MKKHKIVLLLIFSALFFSFARKENPLKKLPKEIRKFYGFVPSQSFLLLSDLKETNENIAIEEFYIANSEITNLQYREFLYHLKEEKQFDLLSIAFIDSTKWLLPNGNMQPFAQLYHWHPAYDEYPVVNISHKGAQLYCSWLENILNQSYGDDYTYTVSLPTHDQWLTAAKGGLQNNSYPWGGPYLRNGQGNFLCNFNGIGARATAFKNVCLT